MAFSLKSVVEPEMDERQMDKEVKKLEKRLDEAEDISPDIDDSGFGDLMDEDLDVSLSGEGGGDFLTGIGVGGGGAGMMGGLTSSLRGLVSALGPLGAGVLAVTLTGAIAVGIWKGIENIAEFAPSWDAVESMFSTAQQLFFLPFGQALSSVFLPSAQSILEMSKEFQETAEDEGIGAALGGLLDEQVFKPIRQAGANLLDIIGAGFTGGFRMGGMLGGSPTTALLGGLIGAITSPFARLIQIASDAEGWLKSLATDPVGTIIGNKADISPSDLIEGTITISALLNPMLLGVLTGEALLDLLGFPGTDDILNALGEALTDVAGEEITNLGEQILSLIGFDDIELDADSVLDVLFGGVVISGALVVGTLFAPVGLLITGAMIVSEVFGLVEITAGMIVDEITSINVGVPDDPRGWWINNIKDILKIDEGLTLQELHVVVEGSAEMSTDVLDAMKVTGEAVFPGLVSFFEDLLSQFNFFNQDQRKTAPSLRSELAVELGRDVGPIQDVNKASEFLSDVRAGIDPFHDAAFADTDVPLQEGGIITGPTRALMGEAGREAVIPLDSPESDRILGGDTAPTENTIDDLVERVEELIDVLERKEFAAEVMLDTHALSRELEDVRSRFGAKSQVK